MNFMLLDILLFFFGYIFKVCVHMNLSSKMGPSLLLLLLLLLLNIKMDPCELWLKSPENLCLILSVVLFFFFNEKYNPGNLTICFGFLLRKKKKEVVPFGACIHYANHLV